MGSAGSIIIRRLLNVTKYRDDRVSPQEFSTDLNAVSYSHHPNQHIDLATFTKLTGGKYEKDFFESLKESSVDKTVPRDRLIECYQVALNSSQDHAHPSIQLINFNSLKKLTEFPRNPENADLLIDFSSSSINVDNSFIIFLSHCWLAGYEGSPDWRGRPHPDNKSNDKFRLSIAGIEKAWRVMAPKMTECYVWIDYSCICQDTSAILSLKHINEFVEICDCLLTVLVDEDNAYDIPIGGMDVSYLERYKAQAWDATPYSYLNRAWCRLEMFYAASIPILDLNSNRVEKFSMGIKTAKLHNRRAHLLYGTREHKSGKLAPIILEPLEHKYLQLYNPCEGQLSVAADRMAIVHTLGRIVPYLRKPKQGYAGTKDSDGKMHGRGILHYGSGNVYEGLFENGLRHGQGKLCCSNGDEYDGQWQHDKRHGRGTFIGADGSNYEGEWCDDARHGVGLASYSDGSSYRGQWQNGSANGSGSFQSRSGKIYRGVMQENTMIQLEAVINPDGQTVYELETEEVKAVMSGFVGADEVIHIE